MKPQFDWSAFGADVRAKRKADGLTVRQLASKISVDNAPLCRAENGKPIGVANFLAILQWLKHYPKKYIKATK